MKNFCRKLSGILKTIFGYGIMICLFAGGMTFFGYLAALIIGGPTATAICTFIYGTIIPYIIYISFTYHHIIQIVLQYALHCSIMNSWRNLICTFRESNTIRLISARLASPAEKARYENGEDYDE